MLRKLDNIQMSKKDHPAWLLTELAMFVFVMLLQYCFQSLKIPTNIHQP